MNEYQDIEFLERLESKYNVIEDDSFAKLVHFQNTLDVPFQRWYPYREGYSYKLVSKFIEQFNVKGALLDPFSGSGSSILAGRYKGLSTYGIDVNPIALFVSKVENKNYYTEDDIALEQALEDFILVSRDTIVRTTDFSLATKYFNADILQALLQIKEYINSLIDEKIRDIFFLSWLSIIESVSNVKKEGNGLKYKNRKRLKKGYENIPIKEWEDNHFPKDRFNFVLDKISSNVKLIIEDVKISNFDAPEPKLFFGSSIDKVSEIGEPIELTIFSPPYVNFFDYFEIHKTELWLGDFIQTQEELRILKKTGLRSNASATVSKSISNGNESVERIITQLKQKKLWSNKILDVVAGYFDDMESLLRNILNITTENGRVVIVVGNSAYAGIMVPTDLLLAEIGEKLGYVVDEIIVTRHLTTSSQQRQSLESVMGFMRESIIVLRKEN